MRLLLSTAKLLLFPQKAHKHITEIYTIFTESAARLRAVRRNQPITLLRIPWVSISPFVIQLCQVIALYGAYRPPFRHARCSMWGAETTIPTCGEPYRPSRYPARPAIWVMRTYFRPAQRSPMTNQSPLITLIFCKTDYLLSLSNGIFTYLLIDCRNLSTFIA